MKALIICDDDKVIAKTKETLASSGYDLIVYRWLLKALDNVEEIEPDLVVLSSRDYPRHWKTFVSHIQTCSLVEKEKMPKVVLFTSEKNSDEEQKKANALGVVGFYSNIEFDGLEKLREIVDGKRITPKTSVIEKHDETTTKPTYLKFERDALPTKTIDLPTKHDGLPLTLKSPPKQEVLSPEPVKKETGSVLIEDIVAIGESLVASDKKNTTSSKLRVKKYDNQKMIFTHPMNKTFITGSIIEISDDEKTIDFTPDILQSIKGISVGDKIKELSLKTLNGMRRCRAEVIKISTEKLTVNIA